MHEKVKTSVALALIISVAIAFVAASHVFHFRFNPNTRVMPDLRTIMTSGSDAMAPATSAPLSTSTPFDADGIYIEVPPGCSPYYEGECANARSGPGTEFPSELKLRSGMVLKVGGQVPAQDGTLWYKIVFDEWLRYPDRLGDLYVASDLVEAFKDAGEINIPSATMMNKSGKLIIVDKANELLSAYDGEQLFAQMKISIGLDGTPTPAGTFNIYKKVPSRYMQGPIPGLSDQTYDLPGVPWTMYFTPDGGAIHGAYWHDHFGQPWSHGCVNLSPADAKKLYEWADIGVPVVVQE